MKVTKISICLPKRVEMFARARARALARERGTPRANVSNYFSRLVVRDQAEYQQYQQMTRGK